MVLERLCVDRVQRLQNVLRLAVGGDDDGDNLVLIEDKVTHLTESMHFGLPPNKNGPTSGMVPDDCPQPIRSKR